MNSYYSEAELQNLGLKNYGKNVLISKKCSLYEPSKISVGSNVRIDDFCILSGDIDIGNYVHISAFTALYGKGGIKIGDFCGISPRSTLFSACDDFSGEYMVKVTPTIPDELANLKFGKIILENFVQLGANTVVMPDITCKEGAVTGACSLVLKDLDKWTINFGIPCKFYQERKRNPKELSKRIKN